MKTVLNERHLLKRAIEEGYVSTKPTDTIRVLIKHHMRNQLDKTQVRQEVDRFMASHFKFYHPLKWDGVIHRMINSYGKSGDLKLHAVEQAGVTEGELDAIRSLDHVEREKFAFSLLVHCKIANQLRDANANWIEADKDVYDDSLLVLPAKEKRLLIHHLAGCGMLRLPSGISSRKVQLNYVDHQGEPIIVLREFTDFVYHYLKWRGDNRIIECVRCTRLLQRTSNRSKYCRPCAHEVQREQKTHWKRSKWYDGEN